MHRAFLYVSLPSLHDYNVKLPNLTFFRGREQKTTTFFFFSWTLMQSFRILNSKKFANIWRIKRDGISAIKFEAAQIHFLNDVFVAVAVVVSCRWVNSLTRVRSESPMSQVLSNTSVKVFFGTKTWPHLKFFSGVVVGGSLRTLLLLLLQLAPPPGNLIGPRQLRFACRCRNYAATTI